MAIDNTYKSASGRLHRVHGLLCLLAVFAAQASTAAMTVIIDEDIDNNGYISADELAGGIDCSIAFDDTVKIGDNFRIDAELETQQILVTSNTADTVVLDVVANDAPQVELLADTDNSGFISAAEYADSLAVEVTLPTTASVNDVVVVNDGVELQSTMLVPRDLAFGSVTFDVPVVAEGETVSVLVQLLDEAGNRSPMASDSATVDTEAPAQPTVNAQLSANASPVINGNYPVDADYLLQVDVNGVIYVVGDGYLDSTDWGLWTLSVPASDALSHGIYDVVVTVSDIAGNRAVDGSVDELTIDLLAPALTVDLPVPAADPAPAITGTTDLSDGGVVRLEDNTGQSVCKAIVEGGGWSCRPRYVLGGANNSLVALVADAAGNEAREAFAVVVLQASDVDGDGIADALEGDVDTDADGVLNYNDLDSDNDSIADSVETAADHDGDGIRNFLDTDSDNDGISDLLEGRLRTLPDTNRDGAIDRFMAVGENGLVDILEQYFESGTSVSPADSDNDGVADYLDYDSDNDGIGDRIENGGSNAVTTGTAALLPWLDSDGDGVPNTLDYDSDQDGFTDLREARFGDSDNNHRIDNFIDRDRDGAADWLPVNSSDRDADGTPDFLDLDSDADNLFDVWELRGVDVNADGILDAMTDANRNGVLDNVDVIYTQGVDQDNDSVDDRFDADYSAGTDSDADGIVDQFDTDANGDGAADSLDSEPLIVIDTDDDGVPDVLDRAPTRPAALRTGTGTYGVGCAIATANADQSRGSGLLLTLWLLLAALGRLRSIMRNHAELVRN